MICGTLFLYSKERRVTTIGTRLQEVEPRIGEVIDKLKEAKYFNKLDLIWGYNNV